MVQSVQSSVTTVVEQPFVQFGREVCGDLTASLRREWLVTNGLGGYASSSVSGINTRKYHGLLVAALAPPVERTVLVGGLVEWAIYDGRRYPLSTHEYVGGTVDPHGYQYLQSFSLEGTLPVWIYACADALVERRLWMIYGTNSSVVMYTLLRGSLELQLEVTPLVTYRSFHALTSGEGWQPGVEAYSQGAVIRAHDGARPFQVLANSGHFAQKGEWFWNFHAREEAARGMDSRSDLFAPGTFSATLQAGAHFSLVLTAETRVEQDSLASLAAERERQAHLLRLAAADTRRPVVQQLTLAADQFIVQRPLAPDARDAAGVQPGKTVIAGYHWFNDWGRDTMIALPGLTLATGRPEEAALILRTFARFVVDGMLPNNFPDSSGTVPGYNTADATLWYVQAIYAYANLTDDTSLVDDLLPVLRQIVDWHRRGTRYHIGVDPVDGLLRAGEPGVQLTWMDAKIGDWVVTPRTGKAVEINALWYNALRIIARFQEERDDGAAREYHKLADRVRESFRARFLRPYVSHLADVVDGPGGDDLSIRPNQIFAVSLPFPLLEGAEAEMVVEAVGRSLLTSYGLRSLSEDNPAYRGDYAGDQFRRDSGYHQGPAWAWLIGAFAEAHLRVYADPKAALALLEPFAYHLSDAGLGSISEICEGSPPHLPRGTIAQAWSVAEVLRAWREIERQIH